MVSKYRENEILRQIQNVRCHNWYIGKKDHDLKITQKSNI